MPTITWAHGLPPDGLPPLHRHVRDVRQALAASGRPRNGGGRDRRRTVLGSLQYKKPRRFATGDGHLGRLIGV